MTIFVTRVNGNLMEFFQYKAAAIKYGEEAAFSYSLDEYEIITWTRGVKFNEAKADTFKVRSGKTPLIRR